VVKEVRLYSKPGCCLCDEAKALLLRLQREQPFAWREIDITGDPALERRWGWEIPVIEVDGLPPLIAPIEETALRQRLAQAGILP